ncbi:MAG: L-serine ammonia-lyase, iron-sulfur-dependent, subunit alpha [Alicyclobacillus herbarius]|uniref:L-serine ammonia-lyase, iron-sulfur-dependent, subunit alpha n=1 Tax=Alicyclobacillus herbarius TaxID=122960 RepID=UPI00235522D5|nr:L-serine ammonia-lyase, iron-sulfur-dependent, subunit alpha [Alicyclobacillus herbarius]MCL6631483.1 L-serine ammonia-lyase, iron-sulfur-dependent, subunit alpha [Alicyclobacillus herbarius]
MSFTRLDDLVRQAETSNTSIARLMIAVECRQSGLSEAQVIQRMAGQFDVMEQAVRRGIAKPVRSRTGLTGGDAYRVHRYLTQANTFVGSEPLRAMAYALAVSEVNAAMGRIVATPTAGAAGILPGVLVSALDSGRYHRDDLVFALFTAAALGLVIANSASISGAAGGCQAEVGSATAMAAGALVELAGGTPSMVSHAAALALQNSLGLVCDPVAGLVEVPCVVRNGLHAITAMAASDMALAGVQSVIPPDEVVAAMRQIGNDLPVSLRETGIGGLAGTPTGRLLKAKVFGEEELIPEGTPPCRTSASMPAGSAEEAGDER